MAVPRPSPAINTLLPLFNNITPYIPLPVPNGSITANNLIELAYGGVGNLGTTYGRLREITDNYFNSIKTIPSITSTLNGILPKLPLFTPTETFWNNLNGLQLKYYDLLKVLTLPIDNLRALNFSGITDLISKKLYLDQLIAQIPAFNTLVSGFGVGFSNFWNTIQSLYGQAKTIIDLVVNAAMDLPGVLKQKITALVNSIVGTITGLINQIRAKITAFKNAVGDAFAPITKTPVNLEWQEEASWHWVPGVGAILDAAGIKGPTNTLTGNGLFGLLKVAFDPNESGSIANLYLTPPFYPADAQNGLIATGALIKSIGPILKQTADNVIGAVKSNLTF